MTSTFKLSVPSSNFFSTWESFLIVFTAGFRRSSRLLLSKFTSLVLLSRPSFPGRVAGESFGKLLLLLSLPAFLSSLPAGFYSFLSSFFPGDFASFIYLPSLAIDLASFALAALSSFFSYFLPSFLSSFLASFFSSFFYSFFASFLSSFLSSFFASFLASFGSAFGSGFASFLFLSSLAGAGGAGGYGAFPPFLSSK